VLTHHVDDVSALLDGLDRAWVEAWLDQGGGGGVNEW
jgi:hypothetical protein